MKTIKDKEYSFNHTKQRLSERYDIDITRKNYDYLCEKVKGKKDAKLVTIEYQKGGDQYTYDLHFRYRKVIRVVWNEEKQYITTALERK
jgi:predicted metalloenzyme YecM